MKKLSTLWLTCASLALASDSLASVRDRYDPHLVNDLRTYAQVVQSYYQSRAASPEDCASELRNFEISSRYTHPMSGVHLAIYSGNGYLDCMNLVVTRSVGAVKARACGDPGFLRVARGIEAIYIPLSVMSSPAATASFQDQLRKRVHVSAAYRGLQCGR